MLRTSRGDTHVLTHGDYATPLCNNPMRMLLCRKYLNQFVQHLLTTVAWNPCVDERKHIPSLGYLPDGWNAINKPLPLGQMYLSNRTTDYYYIVGSTVILRNDVLLIKICILLPYCCSSTILCPLSFSRSKQFNVTLHVYYYFKSNYYDNH